MEYNHEKNNLQSVTKNDNNENLSQKEKNEMCIFGKKNKKRTVVWIIYASDVFCTVIQGLTKNSKKPKGLADIIKSDKIVSKKRNDLETYIVGTTLHWN